MNTTAHDEWILCHRALDVNSHFPDPFTAWGAGDGKRLAAILKGSKYHPRRLGGASPIERDPGYKQIIPYILIYQDFVVSNLYLAGTRAGAEGRLTGRMHLGWGGHLNSGDAAHEGFAGFWRGVMRELAEELPDVAIEGSGEPVGWLNDNGDDVGRHHLGVVFRVRTADVPRPGAGWAGAGWLRGPGLDRLESWSRILVEHGAIA